MPSRRGCLVTGTDTGAGKSVLAATIVATLRARGEAVQAYKPVVTGLDEEPAGVWPPDHELLAHATGGDQDAAQVSPRAYGPPVSPHLAAELAGTPIDPAELIAAVPDGDGPLIVEGVGGLLVPLTSTFSVRDLAVALGLPVVIAARPSLGTINHTLLTLEAARSAGLRVAAVVLTPWDRPDVVARSNRETIARLGEVEVAVLEPLDAPEPELLAAAGERLGCTRWIGAAATAGAAA